MQYPVMSGVNLRILRGIHHSSEGFREEWRERQRAFMSLAALLFHHYQLGKLFGCISCDTILFVSSKRKRLKGRNFAATLIFILITTYQKSSFTE